MFAESGRRSRCFEAISYIKAAATEDRVKNPLEIPAAEIPVSRDLRNGLIVSYLVDESDRFVYVNHGSMVAAGMDQESLHAIGTENLATLASQRLRVRKYEGYHAAFMGGHFEASLLLIDELWDDRFRTFVSGQYVAFIPTRDILAFGDANSASAMKGLLSLKQRSLAAKLDHRVTTDLYVRREGAWHIADL